MPVTAGRPPTPSLEAPSTSSQMARALRLVGLMGRSFRKERLILPFLSRRAEAKPEPLPICCSGQGPGHTPRMLLALGGIGAAADTWGRGPQNLRSRAHQSLLTPLPWPHRP